jgi:hypothetical protein
MRDVLDHKKWTKWKSFPDPRKLEYLFAPVGCGVYQLVNRLTKEFVLFGRGKNLAFRMTSLLPTPLGQGTRDKKEKRDYILAHLENIEYRTLPFFDEHEAKDFEKRLKALNIHIFNENRV